MASRPRPRSHTPRPSPWSQDQGQSLILQGQGHGLKHKAKASHSKAKATASRPRPRPHTPRPKPWPQAQGLILQGQGHGLKTKAKTSHFYLILQGQSHGIRSKAKTERIALRASPLPSVPGSFSQILTPDIKIKLFSKWRLSAVFSSLPGIQKLLFWSRYLCLQFACDSTSTVQIRTNRRKWRRNIEEENFEYGNRLTAILNLQNFVFFVKRPSSESKFASA